MQHKTTILLLLPDNYSRSQIDIIIIILYCRHSDFFFFYLRWQTKPVARQGQDVAVLGIPTVSASAPQGRTFRKHGSM